VKVTRIKTTSVMARFSRGDIKAIAHGWDKHRRGTAPRSMRVFTARPGAGFDPGRDALVAGSALRGYCTRMLREAGETPPSVAKFRLETAPGGEVIGATLAWKE